MLIYKLCSRAMWNAIEETGLFHGSPDDLRDGFIHFSIAEQLAGTAAKYVANQPDILLLTVDTAIMGDALKFEPSRGGALFPHLYAPLPRAAVVRAEPYSA